MRKWILTLALNILIGLLGFCQQQEPLSNSLIDLLQNEDVFLNRKLINPINLTDSNDYLIEFGLRQQWLGSENSTNGLFFSGETNLPSINSSIGINIDFRNKGYFQHYSLNVSYKYSVEINMKSRVNLGLNLGAWQYNYDYSDISLLVYIPNATVEKQRVNSLLLDFGVSYKYKKHEFKLSYNNIINSQMELGESDILLRPKGFIASYQSTFRIYNNFSITPEVFGCFDSNSKYGIISCKLNFFNFFSGGLLYNTKDSFGIFFSGSIKNRFHIGYFTEMESTIRQSYGTHALKLGIIL